MEPTQTTALAATRPTNATAALSTLPQRHSRAYVSWLVVEIGRLAVHIRQQDQLDREGIVAAQMAEDLADTRPAVMQQVFPLARRECTFLPNTAELLALYARCLKVQIELDREAAQSVEREAERAEAERIRLDPEAYFDPRVAIAEALAARRKGTL